MKGTTQKELYAEDGMVPSKEAPRRNRYPLKKPIGNLWRHIAVPLNILGEMKSQQARTRIIVYGR